MDISDKSVCLVGGAGAIGQQTARHLLELGVGRLTIYDNFSSGKRENLDEVWDQCHIVPGDIIHNGKLISALSGVDVVIHLAALGLKDSERFPGSIFETNIRGTMNVLEACQLNEVSRIVFASCATVYGRPEVSILGEGHPLGGTTFYSTSKIIGERLVRSYCHNTPMSGVSLRYFNVYGAPFESFVSNMIDDIQNDPLVSVPDSGGPFFDFIHLQDVARANVLASLAHIDDYEVYNVCTGDSYSLSTLVSMLGRMMDLDVRLEYVKSKDSIFHSKGDPKEASYWLGFDAEVKLVDGLEDEVGQRFTFKRV